MLRYQFLVKTSKLEYCQRIATGHNADDQAETVLMRVLRGAGPDGLAGIPPKRDGIIIRPLLGCWRAEIEEYLAEHDLPFRTDESNRDSKYTEKRDPERAPARASSSYNPQISRSLVSLAAIMSDVSAHFDRMTDAALPEVLKTARVGQFALDLDRLAGYDEALQRTVFRRVFESLRPDLPLLSSRHVENLLSMMRRGDVGASVELPDRRPRPARARLHRSLARRRASHGRGGGARDARDRVVRGRRADRDRRTSPPVRTGLLPHRSQRGHRALRLGPALTSPDDPPEERGRQIPAVRDGRHAECEGLLRRLEDRLQLQAIRPAPV